MFCHCDNCSFDFHTLRKPERCPDCGKLMVRPATVGEMEAYLKLKKIVDHEDWSPVRGVHQVG
jgi:primosomal protein N'